MGNAGHAGAPADTAAEMMRGASNRWGEWPDLGMFKIAQTPLALGEEPTPACGIGKEWLFVRGPDG